MRRNPPTVPPGPPEAPIPDEDTKQGIETRLWASARRHERRMVLLLFVTLLLLTTYFAGLNAYVLRETRPLPYTIDFQLPEELRSAARYAVYLDWNPLEDQAHPTRPVLEIDGSPIPASTENRSVRPTLDLSNPHEVLIRVLGNCTPGTHTGFLRLEKAAGHVDLPDVLSSPVTVAVTSGFWNSWFILRNWGIMLVTVLALLYLFCLLKFPAPAGYLVLVDPQRGFFPVGTIRLKRPFSSVFLPWRRSTLSLKTIWKKARPRIRLRHKAELLFLLPTLPVLLIGSRRAARRFGKLGGVEILSQDIATGSYRPVGRQDVMFSHNTYRYMRGSEDDFIAFAYRKVRPLVSVK